VAPVLLVQRVKGRLQHLVRTSRPRALRGNYALRSIGNVPRDTIEKYIERQLPHHRFADQRLVERLKQYQFVDDDVNLSQARRTSHGMFWHNLHLVVVRSNRDPEWHDNELSAARDMIVRASSAKGYLLSRAGVLPDHLHVLAGCPINESPQQVALGFLNNLAFAHGMRPAFEFGAFVGTVGEYNTRAVRNEAADVAAE
jgi:REP element-mobilizing transposase RayT